MSDYTTNGKRYSSICLWFVKENCSILLLQINFQLKMAKLKICE